MRKYLAINNKINAVEIPFALFQGVPMESCPAFFLSFACDVGVDWNLGYRVISMQICQGKSMASLVKWLGIILQIS